MGVVDFERGVCTTLALAGQREWLVTNGIGGYAMGTVAGHNTRQYHGLLVAALNPPMGRTVLLNRLDETALYAGKSYPLYTNQWGDGSIVPEGYVHLDRFHLEGTTPVWTFAIADTLLEKRVWMQHGANTTYIQYRLARGMRKLLLSIKALVNDRDHHGGMPVEERAINVSEKDKGVYVNAIGGAAGFVLLSSHGDYGVRGVWYDNYYYAVEAYRGLDSSGDMYYAAEFTATLKPGQALTLIASTNPNVSTDADAALDAKVVYEAALLKDSVAEDDPDVLRQLVLAADQFVVARRIPEDKPGKPVQGRTVIAGYPWFGDWGRDTMIALPGLTLATDRPNVAKSILRTFAHFVDQGMLPNRFPDVGEEPEYNTVDATLWYFEAVRATFAQTGDEMLLRDLYPVLVEIINWHHKGTRYDIHVDPADGLLHAGVPGLQLTWMDAKVDDWVVTPRIGKPVEVNALWYNALRSMADFAQTLGEPHETYTQAADKVQASFNRFWNDDLEACFDVIDQRDGSYDAAIRPNQLFAVSLHHSALTDEQAQGVLDVCALHLLTPLGLRSLSPDDPQYIGFYGGDRHQRDGAYHQGTVWGWLMGAYVSAYLRLTGDKEASRAYLYPLLRHLEDGGVGSLSEIFDGDPPHSPRGCFAQAWTVAEVLRVWRETE